MLRDATVAALLEVLERNRIPHSINRAENHLVFTETRSKVLFRAVEEFERLRGSNLAWFGLDELTYTSEEAWLRLEGRLRDPKASRLCGFAVWTPKGYDWVHERFVTKQLAGYETIAARPFENRFLLEQIPDYYDRLRGSYDARFYQQEVLGEYLHLHAGRVYHGFERDRNVRATQVDVHRPLLWALDFNVDPMSSVIAQVEGGRLKVIGEIVLSRATTYQACEEFANRFPSHAAGLRVYADATGERMQTSGASDVGILREFFRTGPWGQVQFKVPRSNPPVRDRMALVNGMLGPESGEARLLVAPACQELIKDFEQVSYKDGTQVIDKERDHKRTHLSDAVGYLAWQEFGNQGAAGERPERLI